MDVPGNLYYTKDHFWIKPEGQEAVIGLTVYGQADLGEVQLVDLPEPGDDLVPRGAFGIIETDRVVSDLVAPVGGEVVEVNAGLLDDPEMVNESPYDDGWLVRVLMDDPDQVEDLMAPDEYADYISGLPTEEE